MTEEDEKQTVSVASRESSSWWLLFPITGLEITDKSAGLDDPCFDDCAIFSRNAVPDVVAQLKTNHRTLSEHDHEKDIAFILDNVSFSANFHSFLAVKRTGYADHLRGSPSQEMIASGTARAYEVASIITLCLLALSENARTCGLTEQMRRSSATVAALDFARGGFMFQSHGPRRSIVVDTQNLITLSRSEIVALLQKSELAGLFDVVMPSQHVVGKSLRNAIAQSAIRLTDALHSLTTATQLLGAVTALEILLSAETADSYDTLVSRTAALVGMDQVTSFSLQEVLGARHRYVHRGEEPRDDGLSINAIKLSMLALLRYSQLAPTFRDRNTVVKYLDLLSKAESVSNDLSDTEQMLLAKLVRQERRPSALAFFNNRDSEPVLG